VCQSLEVDVVRLCVKRFRRSINNNVSDPSAEIIKTPSLIQNLPDAAAQPTLTARAAETVDAR